LLLIIIVLILGVWDNVCSVVIGMLKSFSLENPLSFA